MGHAHPTRLATLAMNPQYSVENAHMRPAVMIVCLVLAACSTVPEHFLDTQGMSKEKLAIVTLMTNEVKILTIDGKDSSSFGGSAFYLPPGEHRFVVGLNWSDLVCVGTACFTMFKRSNVTREACVSASAGVEYHFYARSPGDSWVLHISEKTNGTDLFSGRDINPQCR